MKYCFFIALLMLFCPFVRAQDCVKQVNVPAKWTEEEVVVQHPAIKVLVSAPILDTIQQKICIKEAAYEEYMVCKADGTFDKCTKYLEPEFQTVMLILEIKPAQYLEYGATVEKIKVKKLLENGRIKIVPCSGQ